MKKIVIVTGFLLGLTACSNKAELSNVVQGKVERDEIAVVGKLAGRIDEILVQEGDFVKKGDTLWSISRRYGISIAAIVRQNRIKNPNLIYAGSSIII